MAPQTMHHQDVDYVITLRVESDEVEIPSDWDMRQILSRSLYENGFHVEHVGVDRQ
jgi:hypothetical protein